MSQYRQDIETIRSFLIQIIPHAARGSDYIGSLHKAATDALLRLAKREPGEPTHHSDVQEGEKCGPVDSRAPEGDINHW